MQHLAGVSLSLAGRRTTTNAVLACNLPPHASWQGVLDDEALLALDCFK